MKFFKVVLATMLGIILTTVVFVMISVGTISALVGISQDKKEVKVEENSILKLNFANGVIDQASTDPFDSFDFNTMESKKQLSLKDVIDNIQRAKTDDNIKGIYLSLDAVNSNLANLDEVRKAIVDFKESGKFTIAYGKSIGQAAYYLGSACDKVYMFPEGDLMFMGLGSEVMFFAGAFEKLGIEVQVIRGSNNKFKSAVEPFMYKQMSEANKKQVSKYLNSIWGVWTREIAASRNLSVERVNEIADSVSTFNPDDAVSIGMIDALKYGDEIIAELMDLVEVDDEDDLEMITLGKYARAPKSKDEDEAKPWELNNKVAVIYAAGDITTGKSSQGTMGSRTIASAIKKARLDSTVKAIVLRVNSPGGSALASDIMWREAELAKKEKPLVVSMGGLAASGGYYMSCNADRIFAGENTITGSIGVFGMIPYVGGFLEDKVGVTLDGVSTNPNAGAGSLTKKLTPFQYRKIQQSVDQIYDTFLSHVSEGRGLTKAEVDSIGQGRVWTGKDALEIGLVDELGGLHDAIDYAAKAAELEEGKYRIKTLPEQKDPFEQFMMEFSSSVMAQVADWQFGNEFTYIKRIQELTKREHIQARIPYDFVIE